MAPEPWLRGTFTEIDPVRRAVLHALELAREDIEHWCGDLTDAEIFARPHGLPSIAFQLRHTTRSLDRLLTYAEGRSLDNQQHTALRTEADEGSSAGNVLQEFREGIHRAEERVCAVEPEHLAERRSVGRQRLPSTVAGLLIHCADHTQRHVGQAATTAKVIRALARA